MSAQVVQPKRPMSAQAAGRPLVVEFLTAPENDANHAIAGVLDTLRRARTLLVDPTPINIDRCRAAISQCTRKVVDAMKSDRSNSDREVLRDSLVGIRSELSAISRLLDSAAVFHRNRLQVTTQVTTMDTPPPQTAHCVQITGDPCGVIHVV